MMSLFDEEQIMKSFIRSERHDADVETAKRLLEMGKLSFAEIASGTVNCKPCVFLFTLGGEEYDR